MRLSDEDVAVLLDKFVVAEKSGWRVRRLDDHKQWKSRVDPAKLGSIPDQDLKSHFLECFNRALGGTPSTPSTATESFEMLKGIIELGLLYVVGIQSSVSVWQPGQAPLPKRGEWKESDDCCAAIDGTTRSPRVGDELVFLRALAGRNS